LSLSRGSLHGALWNTVETWGSQLVSFVLFLLFARLIQPGEIGVVQMAVTLLGFLTIFVEHGFSASIIRAPTLSATMLSTAFWLGLGGAVVLALALSALAPVIAGLYDSPELAGVVRVLTWTVPLVTLSSVQTALLIRDLAFKAQAMRRLVAVVGGGIVGIGLALSGAGIWSLVARQAVEALIDCVMAWYLSAFRPGLLLSRGDAREFARFGSRIVGSYALSFLNRRTEDLLIGFALGPLALAYFAVASRAMQLISEVALRAAQRTAVPVFSKLLVEPERLRATHARAVEMAAALSCPIFVGLSSVAPELCVTFFGRRWMPAIPAMRVLGFAGIPMAIAIFTAPLLIATGKAEWLLKFTLAETALNTATAAAALPFGIEGVCGAYVVRSILVTPVALRVAQRAIGASAFGILRCIVGPAVCALAMFAVLSLLREPLMPLPTGLRLVLLVIAGAVFYVAAMSLVARGTVTELLRLVRDAAQPAPAT
jgi:O-antigen/teichoic acid export membrane protein